MKSKEDIKENQYHKILRKQNRKFRRMNKNKRRFFIDNITPCRYRYYNKEKKEIDKAWRENNKEHIRNYSKNYLINNRKKIMDYHKVYVKEKAKTDIQFAIGLRLRNRMRLVIRNYIENGKLPRGHSYKGIKYKEVCKHLMDSSPENWEDYHIDHIVPVCNFDLTNKEELEKLNHYSNLQWLPAEENLIKGKKAYE